jgi:hypothetical protein
MEGSVTNYKQSFRDGYEVCGYIEVTSDAKSLDEEVWHSFCLD